MSTVVQSSNSVSSTFLSTLDHLPCDIVRSLWLVQSCNIKAEREKLRLHELFLQHPYQQPQPLEEIAKVFLRSRDLVSSSNKESVAELESLHAQLKAHHATLKENLDHLEKEVECKPQDASSQQTLRQQLKEHYEKNPLTSRVEALQERVLKESGKVIIKQAQGGATGIRIILNLTKNKNGSGNGRNKSERKRTGLKRSRTQSSSGVTEKVSKAREKDPKKGATLPKGAPKANETIQHLPALPEETLGEVEAEPEVYCFCKQPSFGNMIGCDNEKCKNGEWFHYKCVGLLNRVDALKYTKQKWYCSGECKEAAESKKPRKKRKGNKW